LYREQIDTTENENGVRNDALRSGIFGFGVKILENDKLRRELERAREKADGLNSKLNETQEELAQRSLVDLNVIFFEFIN
jgi:response regulator of citrate/malate metabolism